MLAVTPTAIRADREQLHRAVSLWRSEVRSLQQAVSHPREGPEPLPGPRGPDRFRE
jgi:hypothetical protein